MPLNFILTNAGKAAIVSANNMGTNPIVVSQIAIGSNSWTPTATATALSAEIKRITAVGGSAVADNIIHVTGADSGTDVYTVREVGLYTSGGVLLAIYSQAAAIITKAAATVALLAADLVIEGLPAGSVTVGDALFSYPPATETVKGVMELATAEEVIDGIIATKAVTPSGLQGKTATTARKGIVRIATPQEVIDATSSDTALPPSSFQSIKSALFQSLYPIGEILVTRRSGVPSSWLGFGSWQRYAEGKTLVGLNASDPDFSVVDLTGGAKRHFLNVNEMPNHGHTIDPPLTSTSANGQHYHTYDVIFESGGNSNTQSMIKTTNSDELRTKADTSPAGQHAHLVDIAPFNSGNEGDNLSHNNLQPYTTVNMWVRTA